jgi:hypothetical protein
MTALRMEIIFVLYVHFGASNCSLFVAHPTPAELLEYKG